MTDLLAHTTCLLVGFISGVVTGGLCSAFAFVAFAREAARRREER